MCIVQRTDITTGKPACYDTADFATGTPLRPLAATLTYQDSETLCASFSTVPSSPIYAISRVQNYASATSNPCPSSTATGSTGTTGSKSSASSVIASTLLIVLALIASLL